MKPLILSQPDTSYWNRGEPVTKAWSVGKNTKPNTNSAIYDWRIGQKEHLWMGHRSHFKNRILA
jgi:hypothetical protein